jgi:hypothetical protein
MGTYNEPRPPSGSPVDNEKDVWLADGKVKWGHWNEATGAWIVDATADANGLVGEKGPDGDPCPTGGEADTLDGFHASHFKAIEAEDTWHVVGDSGEQQFESGWSQWDSDKLRFKKSGGVLTIVGFFKRISSGTPGVIFSLPDGYPMSSARTWYSIGSGDYNYARLCNRNLYLNSTLPNQYDWVYINYTFVM